MRQRRTPEFWAEVRRLVEAGLSLKKASVRFGLAYSYLVQKAQWQGWKLCYSGRPRTKDYAEATRRRIQQAKEETQYAEAEAELERKATILNIDLREAQNLTNRVLSTHSMKLKTMLSELSLKVAESLYTTQGCRCCVGGAPVGWGTFASVERGTIGGTNRAEEKLGDQHSAPMHSA